MVSMFPGVGDGVGGMTVNVVGACCGGSGVVVCGNGGVGGVLVRGVVCMDPTVVLPIMNAIMSFLFSCKESVHCFCAVTKNASMEAGNAHRAKSEEVQEDEYEVLCKVEERVGQLGKCKKRVA